MQIQLNTDDHIQGADSLAAWVDSELTGKLSRFRDHVTRIEVHLSDVNGPRSGAGDKRCLLEARIAGRQPVAVSHDAGKVGESVIGAADKLVRALDTVFGKAHAKGRESIRGEGVDE